MKQRRCSSSAQAERPGRSRHGDLVAEGIHKGVQACHHKHDSIEEHPTIVLPAPAVSRWIEDRTGWPVGKFVRTARRDRTIET